tara:strand:+ start:4606 stop:5814 length:1209 start_codon:yes stop_codon:yes gene_type:complete
MGDVNSSDDETAGEIASFLNQPTMGDRIQERLYNAQDEQENEDHKDLWDKIQAIKKSGYTLGEMKEVIEEDVPDIVEKWGRIESGRHYGAPENTRRGAKPTKRRGKAILDNLEEFNKKIDEIEEWRSYIQDDLFDEYEKYHGKYGGTFKVKGEKSLDFTMDREGDPGQWLKLDKDKKTWDSDLRKDVALLKKFRERDIKEQHEKNMKQGWGKAKLKGKTKKSGKKKPDRIVYYHKELGIIGPNTTYENGEIRYLTDSIVEWEKKQHREKNKKKKSETSGDGSGSGSSSKKSIPTEKKSTTTEPPKPWVSKMSRSQKKPYFWNPTNGAAFFPKVPGVFKKEEAEAAEKRAVEKKRAAAEKLAAKHYTKKKSGGRRKTRKKRRRKKRRKSRKKRRRKKRRKSRK